MDHFLRRGDELYAEDVPLASIAAQFGSPTYVYSQATIERHVSVLQHGLAALPHLICYAIKANGNPALLQLLHRLGCAFDAVSVGELALALKCGIPAARIILSGVGKRDDEIRASLAVGVLYLSVESASELAAIERIAHSLGVRAPVVLRVNPDVDAATHPYIATGLRENKFGLDPADALQLIGRSGHHVELLGLTCHIGSQITDLAPFIDAAKKMRALVEQVRASSTLRFVGVGGGLGVPYIDEDPPPPERYGAALAEILQPLGLTVVLEPGRVIVGNAGVLLTRVVRCKTVGTRSTAIVDAGMNDLLRPALYGARHAIAHVTATDEQGPVDIVGPVCESADVFARGVTLPAVREGDLLVVRTTGAYGFAMASAYNGRPLPAEVLVSGADAHLVRQRESVAMLWRGAVGLDGCEFSPSLPL